MLRSRAAVECLNELGYWCDLLQVDAKHFLPQSRPRMFAVQGHRVCRKALRSPRRSPARAPRRNFSDNTSGLMLGIWIAAAIGLREQLRDRRRAFPGRRRRVVGCGPNNEVRCFRRTTPGGTSARSCRRSDGRLNCYRGRAPASRCGNESRSSPRHARTARRFNKQAVVEAGHNGYECDG